MLPLAPGPGLSGWLFGLGYTISPFNSAGGRGAATVSPFPPPARAPWRVSTCCGKVAVKRQGATGTGATRTGPAALGHLRAGRWRRAGGTVRSDPGCAEIGAAVPRRGPARAEEGIAGAPREPTHRFGAPAAPAGPLPVRAAQSPVSLCPAPPPSLPLWLSPPAPSSAMVLG